MNAPHDILVVGGGVSGLSQAASLAERGYSVTVWEADHRLGGKIQTDLESGYRTERAASMIYNFLPAVDRLLAKAGLDSRRLMRHSEASRRYLVKNGRPQQVPITPLAFLFSPFWDWRTRMRILAEPLAPRCESGTDESVADFITRRLGREFLEQAIDPFVGGTLASDTTIASARATLPRLTALEDRFGSLFLGAMVKRLALWRRSIPRATPFSFPCGMAELTAALRARAGSDVHTGVRLQGMEPIPGGKWRVTGERDGTLLRREVTTVVLALPAPETAALIHPLDPALSRLLTGIRYAPVGVVHTGFRREEIPHPMDGIGALVPPREGLRLTGTLWLSSAFQDRAPHGHALMSNYMGGIRQPDVAEMGKEQAAALVLADLRRMLNLRADPVWMRVDMHRRGLPIYDLGHLGRMAGIDRRLRQLPGLRLTGNWRDGVAIRDRLASAAAMAATFPLPSTATRPQPSPSVASPCPAR